ncbi:MAG: potassium transporter TrkG [Eubacteriaceae bacterium]|nr:potassium transporter TrkG [Eubacteriaceae bacterium]
MTKIIKTNNKVKDFMRNRSPAEILVFGFASVIFIGSLLLSLPIASQSGSSPGYLNCLFTSTSSVCVTGLVVVDTGTYWSVFGQIVIIFLIQIGGLGFMSLMTIIFVVAGKRITIKNRLLLQSSVNSDRVQGVVKFTKYIVGSSLLIELIGAVLLSIVFIPDYGLGKGIYFGIFHSISSFCNAGFDLIGNFNSFVHYVNNGLLSFTVCALIAIGGIGFAVTSDIVNYPHTHRLSLHSKIVLTTTVILILGGAILFYIFEYNNPLTMGNLPWYGKVFASFFQSVTPRTAGSNTIVQADMTSASKNLTMLLMFIGGSPGSTAGGVKTATVAVMFIILLSGLTGKKDVTCFKRRISEIALRQAACIFFIGFIIVFCVFMILSITDSSIPAQHLLFEVFSAYSTVGLSCGVTPSLSILGRIALIITMFIGRVGPLTIAFVITRKERRELENKGNYKLPDGNVLLG